MIQLARILLFSFLLLLPFPGAVLATAKSPIHEPDVEPAIVFLNVLDAEDDILRDDVNDNRVLKKYFAEKYPERPIFDLRAETGGEIRKQLRLIGSRKISHFFVSGHGRQSKNPVYPASFLTVGEAEFTFENGSVFPYNPFKEVRGRFTPDAQIAFSACEFLHPQKEIALRQQISLKEILGLQNGDIYCNTSAGVSTTYKVSRQAQIHVAQTCALINLGLTCSLLYQWQRVVGKSFSSAASLLFFSGAMGSLYSTRKIHQEPLYGLTEELRDLKTTNQGFSAHIEGGKITKITDSTYEDALAEPDSGFELLSDPFYKIPNDV